MKKKLFLRITAVVIGCMVGCMMLPIASDVGFSVTRDSVMKAQNRYGVSSWKTGPRQKHPVTTLEQLEIEEPRGLPFRYIKYSQPKTRSRLGSSRDGESPLNSGGIDLPAKWDWRDVNGRNFMSRVVDQGTECGACVAFATAATVEAALNIACNQEEDAGLSEQYVFSCGGGQCNGGWKLSHAPEFVSLHGIPDRPCMPYLAMDGNDVSCETACSDVENRLIKGITWEKITTGWVEIDKVKEALLRGPLLSNMILFEDFELYESGVYRHVDGAKRGGHAIVIVGWEPGAWIVKNSNGPDWGENGYFRIAMDDPSLVGRYTYLFTIQNANENGLCSLTQ